MIVSIINWSPCKRGTIYCWKKMLEWSKSYNRTKTHLIKVMS